MDHRKFKKCLKELLEGVTDAQAQKVVTAFQDRGDGGEVHKLMEQNLAASRICVHCGKSHIHRHGVKNGLQRYKCADCKKTFNALTNTALSGLRKKELWLKFSETLKNSDSVRSAANQVGVDKTTSFRWRHRFLKAQKEARKSEKQTFSGIVEIDETVILESKKGKRDLQRKPRKRGGKAQKRGLSAEQIPILIVRDRNGNHVDFVLPNRSQKAIHDVLKGLFDKDDTLICMDGDKAVIAFAKAEKIEYRLIIASKNEHVHEGIFHIQNVNAYMSRLKKWLGRFNGVATKYLPNYLAWRRSIDKSAHTITAKDYITAALG
jgi:transposase-like protein